MMAWSFVRHCLRRAGEVRRVMAGESAIPQMAVRLGALRPGCRPVELSAAAQRRIAALAEACSWMHPSLWRRRCLFRSLIILDWARTMGLDPAMNIGMRFDGPSAQGHCWLSLNGACFCEARSWPGGYPIRFLGMPGATYWVGLKRAAPARGETPAPSAQPTGGA